jgi:hypothetical protein
MSNIQSASLSQQSGFETILNTIDSFILSLGVSFVVYRAFRDSALSDARSDANAPAFVDQMLRTQILAPFVARTGRHRSAALGAARVDLFCTAPPPSVVDGGIGESQQPPVAAPACLSEAPPALADLVSFQARRPDFGDILAALGSDAPQHRRRPSAERGGDGSAAGSSSVQPSSVQPDAPSRSSSAPVCVLVCGPPTMVAAVRHAAAALMSEQHGTRFDIFVESFET